MMFTLLLTSLLSFHFCLNALIWKQISNNRPFGKKLKTIFKGYWIRSSASFWVCFRLHAQYDCPAPSDPRAVTFLDLPLLRWWLSAAVRSGWAGSARLAPADTRPAEDTRFYAQLWLNCNTSLERFLDCSRNNLPLCVGLNHPFLSP